MPSSTSSSDGSGPDGLRPAHPLSFFDPEQVERPVPARSWRMLAVGSLIATAALTIGWELYWRANRHEPGDFKNTAALWAQERRKATGDATVILGASRIFFGADLDAWEKVSGRDRPIQLALEGTSPRSFLEDLANDERFRGLAIVDYTGLNFIRRGGRREDVLEYAANESLSQRADHHLSKMLERRLAFIDEQTRPKRMIFLAALPPRAGMAERTDPHKLMRMTESRDTEMWNRVVEDEEYRALAKNIWRANNDRVRKRAKPGGDLAPALRVAAFNDAVAEIKRNVDKIRMRGGDVAFVRYPFEGDYTELEHTLYPRERYWDQLVAATGSAGVSFEDYAELQGYDLPEWSHLSPREAERYTAALVPILYEEIRRKAAERGEASE